jgi:hypothetical protein
MALSGAAAWLVLVARPRPAGALAGAAGTLLIAAGRLAERRGRPLERILDSLADRVFDGAVLSALAWTARDAHPVTAAGALTALAAGFLGSYVRARGASLGYGVEESGKTRGLRYLLVAGGLAAGWTRWTVWAVVAVSALAAAVRASQVAKEERA